MKRIQSVAGVLTSLAMGLMFLTTSYAQTEGVETQTAIMEDQNAEVCVYKITGKGDMTGMRCEGCTKKVETALEGVSGVISVDAVDLETQTATVTISKNSKAKEQIPSSVEKAGFVATLEGEEIETGEATPDESRRGLFYRIRSLLKI